MKNSNQNSVIISELVLEIDKKNTNDVIWLSDLINHVFSNKSRGPMGIQFCCLQQGKLARYHLFQKFI